MNRVQVEINKMEESIRRLYSDPMCPSDVAGEFAESYRSRLPWELEELGELSTEEQETMNEYLGIIALNRFERKVYRNGR